MKKTGYVVLIIIFICLFLRCCVNVDIPDNLTKPSTEISKVEMPD